MKPFVLAALLLAVGAASTAAAQPSDGHHISNAATGFVARFRQGCLGPDQNKPSSVREQYCNCMLQAYQQRYSESELTAITELASQAGKVGPAVVNAMMSPERRRCAQP